tara:strand:+ start:187 stop:543 length:357 start_codon:yes stop_codon:yes gene_type:complete
MAEGFANSLGWQAFSGGTHPESAINPFAVKVMNEIGIDISKQMPQSVYEYLHEDFHIVATVCDDAFESCPVFTGKCGNKIHKSFKDPAMTKGNSNDKLIVFRKVRDDIHAWIDALKFN